MKAEEKKRYFTETALALNREGFRAETIVSGTLGVWFDDEPLCEVSEVGGITYRGENISTPERVTEKDKAYEIVSTTAEYMRQMEQACHLKANDLTGDYRILADFNGTVLPERTVNSESSLSLGIGIMTVKVCLTATTSPETTRKPSGISPRGPA